MAETKVCKRLELVDWVDELCDQVETIRGLKIPVDRRSAMHKALKARGFPDYRREFAERWCLGGDWNRKKGAKTLELSDFFPSAEQLAQFDLDVVPVLYHQRRLKEVMREGIERGSAEVRRQMAPTKLRKDLEEQSRILVRKTRRILELSTDITTMRDTMMRDKRRISELMREVENMASERAKDRRYYLRALNDQFRMAGPDGVQLASSLPSWVILGNDAIEEHTQDKLINAIRSIESFDTEICPDHDWGHISVDGIRFTWRIIYRDRLASAPGNPFDLRTCRRMLAISQNEEIADEKINVIGAFATL